MPNNHNTNRSTSLAVTAGHNDEIHNSRFETGPDIITWIVNGNFMSAILSSEFRKQVLGRDIALTCQI